MRRHGLTDAQWERLRPLLPPLPAGRGRPRADDRTVVEGILWRLATGAPWRDLPERFGPWATVYSRFRRWQRAGVWDRVLAELQADADARGEFDWSLHFLDGTVIRAHPHAAGAPKKGATTTIPRIRRSAGARAASPPRSTSASRAGASR